MTKRLPQRHSLVSQTTDILREEIARGAWAKFLPGERELAIRLCISRPTLRAALDILRREGVIEVSERTRRKICHIPVKALKHVGPRRVVLLTPIPPHRFPPFVMFWMDEMRQRLGNEGF